MRQKIAKTSDVLEGKSKLITLDNGEDIVLFHVEGKFYALPSGCPHMGGPLDEGKIEGHVVTCPWHGWEFDVRSGACIHGGWEDTACFKVDVEDDDVFVNL